MYIDGKLVSDEWYDVLSAARRAGVVFRLNSGRRTMTEQWRLYKLYLAGIGNLAAYPNPNAPHIREGRIDHALDVDMYFGGGIAALRRWLDSKGLDTHLPVAGEGWHLEAISAAQLREVARRLSKPLTVMDRLRAQPLRRGTQSPDVKKVQVYLKRGGYWNHKIADEVGTMGPVLVASVKRFQRDNKLAVDGIVGPRTFELMRKKYNLKVWKRNRKRTTTK